MATHVVERQKPAAWAIEQCRTPPDTAHLWQSLHLALPLWDSQGKFAEDVSGLNLHASGTWGSGVSWITGELGRGLDFTGTGCYIDVPDPPANYLDGCTAFTAELWFETDEVTGTFGLFGKYRAVNGYRSWRFYILNGEIEMQISADGTAYEAKRTTSTPIAVGTLYHLVVVYNAGVFQVWVNGVSQTTQGNFALTSIYGGIDYMQIGKRYDSVYFNGRMYSVRFWQRALSAEEIAILYDMPFRMYEPDFDLPTLAVDHGAAATPPGEWILAGEIDPGVQELYCSGLQNGISYDVYAKTMDLSSNESTGCTIESATPVAATGGVNSQLRRGVMVGPVVPPIVRRYR